MKEYEKVDNLNNQNINIKNYKKIKTVLCIIGIILIFIALRSIYLINKSNKTYEEKGWLVAEAVCTEEKQYIKRNDEDSIRYYKRIYLYTVAEKQYTLNVEEVFSTPSNYVVYDSTNPNVAEVYQKSNISTIVVLVIGLLCLFYPVVLKFINFEKITKIKEKNLKSCKRSIGKIIDICFWIYLGTSLLLIIREIFMTPNWSQMVLQYTKLEVFVECFIFIISGVVLKNLHIILIYIASKIAIKKFKKEKLSEVDFKKYEAYYRDILKEYSPAELSYIDKFEVVPENDIAASLLSLELKNKIVLDEEIKINDITSENMSSNEKYVLDSIENGKITKFDMEEFSTKVKLDALKNGLLKETKIEIRKFKKIFAIVIPFIVLLIAICVIIFRNFITSPYNVTDLKIFILVFAMLLVLYIPIAIGSFFSTYIQKMIKNAYIRTKKGEDLNEKLEGLKNYLKDFSTISEKDEKSLSLWEDYLIYSVIFNQNTKVRKNIWNKYIDL